MTPAPAASASEAVKPAGGRIPLIKFPPRRTPAGEIISSMPAAEARQWIAKLTGTMAAEASSSEQPHEPPVVTTVSEGGWPSTSGRGYPARQIIPEHEMEAILLGGAEP